MIREGHVIEFNDGSLDLPRAKPPKKEVGEGAENLPPETAAVATTPTDITMMEAATETPETVTEPATVPAETVTTT
jgi:hypothetical protein